MGTCDKDISCVSVMLSENNAHTKNISQNNTNGKKKLTPPEKMSKSFIKNVLICMRRIVLNTF